MPEGFRGTMREWGLWTYRVMLFEREGNGRFRSPEWYPADALATFNTHDLPSFRGWSTGHDLAVKRGLGIDPGESDEGRGHALAALKNILTERVPAHAFDDIAAVAAFLAATPSKLVMVALDDIAGQVDQVNIPGTVDQHPNWRRRVAIALEEIAGCDALRRVADVFRQAGRSFKG